MRSRKQSVTVPAKSEVSLAQFMRAKARGDCIICTLPAAVRAQLGRGATKRGFTREDQVEWLRTACGATRVTLDVLANHLNGRHDRGEDGQS